VTLSQVGSCDAAGKLAIRKHDNVISEGTAHVAMSALIDLVDLLAGQQDQQMSFGALSRSQHRDKSSNGDHDAE
jgi:hypothetical protein